MLRLDVSMSAHVIFVQYLLGLSIVQALKTFDKELPVALKWPNDIYARRDDKWVKIGGILINSHFIDNQFTLVAGLVSTSPIASLRHASMISQKRM